MFLDKMAPNLERKRHKHGAARNMTCHKKTQGENFPRYCGVNFSSHYIVIHHNSSSSGRLSGKRAWFTHTMSMVTICLSEARQMGETFEQGSNKGGKRETRLLNTSGSKCKVFQAKYILPILMGKFRFEHDRGKKSWFKMFSCVNQKQARRTAKEISRSIFQKIPF